jgi:hypothetical protein
MESDFVDWIGMAEDDFKLNAFVNIVMNLRASRKHRIRWLV